MSNSKARNEKSSNSGSRRKQKFGVPKSFNFKQGLGPLSIKKKFNRVAEEDDTHITHNPTINISLLPKQYNKDRMPTLQSPI
jgi:hypothetical protein